MKTMSTLVCTMFFTLSALAQQSGKTISGQVKDIQNEPVVGATLQLLQAHDSAIIQTKMARAIGRFEFTNLRQGTYLLTITATGTQQYRSAPLTLDSNRNQLVLPAIVLLPQKKAALKEVVVTARKPLLEQDIDKTIVNVESMISSATSNTLEVLEKTPGITVDANGEISLNGATGVNVLIDGRPTYMSGRDLAAYLRSLPGSMLDKIELMTNPPARFDANGGAVINIRLKRKRTQGYTGSASINYNQGRLARSYNSVNLNYLNRKVNLFGNFSYGRYTDFGEEENKRQFYAGNSQKSAATSLETYTSTGANEFSGRLGMDYTLSGKTTIGVIGNASSRRRKELMSYASNSYGPGDVPDSVGWGNGNTRNSWRQLSANVNLQHKFDEAGRELTADVNYIYYGNKGKQLLQNFLSGPSGGPLTDNEFLYDLPSHIDIYTARADYAYPLKNKVSFSAGLKSSFVQNDNLSNYYAVESAQQTPDYGRSNHFIYDENINAAYVNGRKDWKRFGMQLGLRFEHTQIKGRQLGNAVVPASSFTNDYNGLFPTAYFSYKLDSLGRHTLAVNYARRINRPGYQQLNPFVFFIDQYSYNTGNPYLKPSYGNRGEIYYRFKQLATLIASYEGHTDGFYGAARVEDNILITRSENIATRQMAALLLYLNLKPANWWTANFHIAGARFETRGQVYAEKLDLHVYTWRTNILNQFRLPADWAIEVYAAYNAPNINWQRIVQARYWVNTAVQKKLLKGKASLKVNFDDIFYTLRWKDETKGLNNATAFHIGANDTRRVGIAFSYSFGKEIFARKRQYNDNTADDVKERAQ